MFKLFKKLKIIKYEIKDWSKKQFGNLHEKLTKNATKIDYVEEWLLSNSNSYRFNSQMNCLLRQREKMTLFNKKYWGKLNRKECLVHGDRNSKYVQRRANARRKRKLVIKLKDACGVWIDNLKAIVDKFSLDYSKRFKSTHSTNRTLPNLGLVKLISDTENCELIRLSDMEEIK